MSQENVEIIRQGFEAFNRGGIDEALDAAADDFTMDYSNSIGTDKGVYRGKREVRAVWSSLLSVWDEVRMDPEEIIEVDESTVVVVVRTRGRGRGSGVPVEALAASVYTIRDGEAKSATLYQSKAEALEAVGLRSSA